ncbi:hypothetical protein K438DRAFT_1829458, partial [Mycena galopus ATCC 62051]
MQGTSVLVQLPRCCTVDTRRPQSTFHPHLPHYPFLHLSIPQTHPPTALRPVWAPPPRLWTRRTSASIAAAKQVVPSPAPTHWLRAHAPM